MIKKIFLLLFMLFFSTFIFTSYANDSRWYWISSNDTASEFVDTQQIGYDPTTDTARFWSKFTYTDGHEIATQYEVNFTNKTMKKLCLGDAKTGIIKQYYPNSRPFAIAPESRLEKLADVVASQLGKPLVYDSNNPQRWLLVKSTPKGNIYILPEFLDYDAQANTCYVWAKFDYNGSSRVMTLQYICYFTDESIQPVDGDRFPIMPNSIFEAIYDATRNLIFKTK